VLFEDPQLTIPGVSRRKLRPNSIKLKGAPIYMIEFSLDGGRTWQLGMTQSVRRTKQAAREQGWLTRTPKRPRAAPQST
jgi:hypothetical protein